MKLKSIIISMLSLLIFAVGLSFSTVEAAEDSIVDEAGLLSETAIAQLKAEILPIEEKIKGRVFVATTDNNTYSSAQEFADYFLLNRIGADNNGVVFLIDMDTRQFYISTSGNMIDYLDDRRIENSLDAIEPEMKNGNYDGAAQVFVSKIDEYVQAGVPRGHYRIDSETGKITYYRTISIVEGIIAFVLAAVIAVIVAVVIISRYQLKSSSYNYPYREKSNGKIAVRNDVLVNSFVTTRRIPRSNSSGGGGGGSTTHSTGGGSFGGGGRGF